MNTALKQLDESNIEKTQEVLEKEIEEGALEALKKTS